MMIDCLNKRLLHVLICMLLISCSRPPEASYYDAEGIVSILAAELDGGRFWERDDSPVAASIVSKELDEPVPGAVTAPFYVRTPGSYALWVLGASIGHVQNRNTVQVRFTGSDGEFISTHRLELPRQDHPEWVHRDQFTEDPAVLHVDSPGFYNLQFESGGFPGLVITKIHLSREGSVRPEGMGYPETTDWRMDPVMDKRLEQAFLPPAWSFGAITNSRGGELFGDRVDAVLQDNETARRELFHDHVKKGRVAWSAAVMNGGEDFYLSYHPLTPSEVLYRDENRRTLWFYPLRNLQESMHMEYPAPWLRIDEGFAGLAGAVESIANPLRATYESPYTVLLPDWSGSVEPELFVRTMQVLAFQPLFYLPFPETGVPEGAAELFEELVKWRQQHFPYIYSYTLRARTTGEKPVTGRRDTPRQFLFGEHFLVAPVLEEGLTEQTLHLPEGSWYRYGTGDLVEGGRTVHEQVDLYTLPLYVKAGAVVPARPDPHPVLGGSNDRLEVNIFTGDSGTFRLYEDDGETAAYRTGAYSTIAYRYFEGEGYATFNIGAMVNGFEGRRDTTEYLLQFRYMEQPDRITANGEELGRGEAPGMWQYGREGAVIRWTQPDRQRTVFRIEF